MIIAEFIYEFTLKMREKVTTTSDYDQFWKDNFRNLLENQEKLTDVKIVSGLNCAHYGAHRVLLARVSGYLNELMTDFCGGEDDVTVMFPDFNDDDIKGLIALAYTGTLENLHENSKVKILKI